MSGIRIISEENGKLVCICGYKATREERIRPGGIGSYVVPCPKCGSVTFKNTEFPDLEIGIKESFNQNGLR